MFMNLTVLLIPLLAATIPSFELPWGDFYSECIKQDYDETIVRNELINLDNISSIHAGNAMLLACKVPGLLPETVERLLYKRTSGLIESIVESGVDSLYNLTCKNNDMASLCYVFLLTNRSGDIKCSPKKNLRSHEIITKRQSWKVLIVEQIEAHCENPHVRAALAHSIFARPSRFSIFRLAKFKTLFPPALDKITKLYGSAGLYPLVPPIDEEMLSKFVANKPDFEGNRLSALKLSLEWAVYANHFQILSTLLSQSDERILNGNYHLLFKEILLRFSTDRIKEILPVIFKRVFSKLPYHIITWYYIII